MSDKYDHIINLPHRQSRKRKQMSLIERAAQFGAFRALSGYEDAIEETGRITDKRIELDEYAKAELDRALHELAAHIDQKPIVTVTYFVPDDKKQGGAYLIKQGIVKKIRSYERQIVFCDGEEIPLHEIVSVEVK